MKDLFRAYFLSTVVAASFVVAACGGTQTNLNSANNNREPEVSGGNTSTAISNVDIGTAPSAKPFKAVLELHGIKFTVESPNTRDGNLVKITPSGLEVANDPITRNVSGEAVGAEIGDLNVDQSPEIYIYVRKPGDRKETELVAFAANNRKSLSEIALAADDLKSKDMVGYNGEDEFAVVENTLVRRFPVFDGSGAAALKTGKMRQFQYKLKKGESAWQLVSEKTVEY